MPQSETLARIDASCRRVAASTAVVERSGGLLVHRPLRGFPLAARPAGVTPVTMDDVRAAVGRQRASGLPVRVEWIAELDRSLGGAALEAGLTVAEEPLLVLTGLIEPSQRAGVEVRMTGPDDPGFAEIRSAVDAGFRGRDVLEPERSLATVLERTRAGALRVCGARDPVGAVGGGTSVCVDRSVVELTGIAVVPRARRRGIGAAVTHDLAADAVQRGAGLVWLSATDDAAASVYERVGFGRVGTTCVATDDG